MPAALAVDSQKANLLHKLFTIVWGGHSLSAKREKGSLALSLHSCIKEEVEKELIGRETKPWEIVYFKLQKSQIPCRRVGDRNRRLDAGARALPDARIGHTFSPSHSSSGKQDLLCGAAAGVRAGRKHCPTGACYPG